MDNLDFSQLGDDQLVALFRAVCQEAVSRNPAVASAVRAAALDEAEKARIAAEAARQESLRQADLERQRVAEAATLEARRSADTHGVLDATERQRVADAAAAQAREQAAAAERRQVAAAAAYQARQSPAAALDDAERQRVAQRAAERAAAAERVRERQRIATAAAAKVASGDPVERAAKRAAEAPKQQPAVATADDPYHPDYYRTRIGAILGDGVRVKIWQQSAGSGHGMDAERVYLDRGDDSLAVYRWDDRAGTQILAGYAGPHAEPLRDLCAQLLRQFDQACSEQGTEPADSIVRRLRVFATTAQQQPAPPAGAQS